MMVRNIAHLDILDFYATLEELRRPELKRKPVALAELSSRAVIQGVNGIARSEGIREGMPLSQARRFCRRLATVPPDLPFYKERHEHILQNLSRFSPLVEGTFWGHYFIDLTGTKRLWGPGPDVACRIERQLAAQNGLYARVGLAANKLISRVAASCIKPGELSCIFPGGEGSFLSPLPVTSLPGVGPKTAARLNDFNIQRIGQLAGLSSESLFGVFGTMGSRLLQIARGIDPTPVLPFQTNPRLCVTHNLERDEIDGERLEAILFRLSEEAGWTLRRQNRCPGRFVLEVRYADGVVVRKEYRLSLIASHVDYRLFQAILSAFEQLVQRRMAVRRIALELSHFSMPLRQMSLFPWEETSLQRDRRLQNALDGIRLRFGRQAVSWGRSRE